MKPALLLALALVGCGPKAPPAPAVPTVDRAAGVPAPLAARPFTLPAAKRATLSNGLTVMVVEDRELPLAWVRLSFRGGGHADPVGKEGLASVTLDMLNEGAGSYDALALSAALKALGSDLGAGAGDDGASIWASGLSRNLDPTLDLFADVLLRPTFPEAEWDLLKKQRLADLEKQRKNPEWIASRVFDEVFFGDAYKGRVTSKASYEAITTADMKAFWAEELTPDRAILFAGGDVSLEELVPKLEARLKDWKPAGTAPFAPVKQARPALPEAGAIHVVDRPGAAQSVVRIGGYLSSPTEADWFPLLLANHVVGGQFTARLNMNLREEKGWTYGARSGFSYDLAGGRFVASAGIHTEFTGQAVAEALAEIAGPRGPEPLTAAELDDGRNALVLAWPLRFESPDYLLGQEEAVWRYGLPADWVSGYVGRLTGGTLEQAAAAWNGAVDPARLVVVVVGDLEKIRPELEKLGRPLIAHDPDGNVLPPTPAP